MTDAASWQHNALFRVLAFLDNTGTQCFDLQRDIRPDGSFCQPSTLFAPGTAIYNILLSGVRALRLNIARLTHDKDELREALLPIFGSCEHKSHSSSPVTSAQTQEAHTSAEHALPMRDATAWCQTVLAPVSLTALAHSLGDAFVSASQRRELCALMDVSEHAFTDSALIEQFFIDALDDWVGSSCLAESELNRIVLACGVQPTVLQAVRERSDRMPRDCLVDFIVDVIFPVRGEPDKTEVVPKQPYGGGGETSLEDWLMACYRKNHEAVSVDESSDSESSGVSGDSSSEHDALHREHAQEIVATGTAADVERKSQNSCVSTGRYDGGHKRLRYDAATDCFANGRTIDATGEHVMDSADVEEPDEQQEELLTQDNISHYMAHQPKRVPQAVVRAHRRAWSNPAITRFELHEHYTVDELRAVVRMLANLNKHNGAGRDAMREKLELDLGHAIDRAVCVAASKAKRKDQFIDVLLSLHK